MKKSSQVAIAIAAMAIIGSVYGWSGAADVLASSHDWPAAQAVFLFAAFAVGIGFGVAVSGVLLVHLRYAKTIAVGLALWGIAALMLSQTGFRHDSIGLVTCLALLGGSGVGIAYLALVSLFRNLFVRPTVISGLIGPLGFASGTAVLCITEAINPGITGIIEIYRALGMAAVLFAVVVFLCLAEPPFATAPFEQTNATKLRRDLLSLWVLLSLNVAPGMALVAIAVPWLRNLRSSSFGDATWTLCGGLIALPLGQTVGGICANRWGDRKVFFLMFFLRFLLFSAAAISPREVWPWLFLAIILACHGSGFGLLPKMIAKSSIGSNTRLLGLVLTGWGAGGAVGVTAMLPIMNDVRARSGYVILAGLMLSGALLSSKDLRYAGARSEDEPDLL